MAYVKCHGCERMVHFKPVNVEEFHKKYVKNNEPIYCYHCFKKLEKEEKKDE